VLKNVPENAIECLHSPFFYSQVLFSTVRSHPGSALMATSLTVEELLLLPAQEKGEVLGGGRVAIVF